MVWGLAGLLAVLAQGVPQAAADPLKTAQREPAKDDHAAFFTLPGEDAPGLFVPEHPRSVEDQRHIEAVRDYSAARAMEDQKKWSDSIALLEEALKIEPDSIAILRRLSRLCFGRGETEQALRYSNRVLEADPGDTGTISRLVMHYLRKNDPAGAEGVLKSVLANPNLDPHSSGRLLAQYELGKLYATKLQQPELAADLYATVVGELMRSRPTGSHRLTTLGSSEPTRPRPTSNSGPSS